VYVALVVQEVHRIGDVPCQHDALSPREHRVLAVEEKTKTKTKTKNEEKEA
jgi:hypothetical protein